MAANPTAGLVQDFDADLPLWQDTQRTIPAAAHLDPVLAIGDAVTGLDPVGAQHTPGAGVVLRIVDGKRYLAFPGTPGVGVTTIPAGGVVGLAGAHVSFVRMTTFYSPTVDGSVRYLSRLSGSGNPVHNLFYPDQRLLTAKRATVNAQVIAQIEAVGTKEQVVIVFERFTGNGTSTTLSTWIDKGDGAGAVRVSNEVAITAGQTDFTTLRMGDAYNGYIRRQRIWTVAPSDADVVDTMAAARAANPPVSVTAINIDNEAALREFSARQGFFTLTGTVQNPAKAVASIHCRIIDSFTGNTVRALQNTGAVIEVVDGVTKYRSAGIALPVAGIGYLLEFVLRDADGAAIGQPIRKATTFMVGYVIYAMGSSTPARGGYEFDTAGAAKSDMALMNADTETTWRVNDKRGSMYHAMYDVIRPVIGEPIIVVNTAQGARTLHFFAYGTGEGPPGTVPTSLSPYQITINAYALTQCRADAFIYGVGANDSFKPYQVPGADAGSYATVRNAESHAKKLDDLHKKNLALFGLASAPAIVLGMHWRPSDLVAGQAPIGSEASARASIAREGEMRWARSSPLFRYVGIPDAATPTTDIHLTSGGTVIAGTALGLALVSIIQNKPFQPEISHEVPTATGADIVLLHTSGTSLAAQPPGGWSCFRTYNARTGARVAYTGPVTTAGAARVSLPFTRAAGEEYHHDYLSGAAGGDDTTSATAAKAAVLKDNNGLQFKPTNSIVGTVIASSGERFNFTNV